MAIHFMKQTTILCCAAFALAACEDGPGASGKKAGANDAPALKVSSANLPEVEAPEVFDITEKGLWDGRPSLGGVWVAHPDVKKPQRVIIKNLANNKSIKGALFRKSSQTPGPSIQLSSDAAEAIGIIAGQPIEIQVTALKKVEPTLPDLPPPAAEGSPEAAPAPTPESVATAAIDETEPQASPAKTEAVDIAAAATAAIGGAAEPLEPLADSADDIAEVPADGLADAPETPRKPRSGLFAIQKPFVQVATFTNKENADQVAATLTDAGMAPVVKESLGETGTIWRVLAGPAESRAERREMLKTVKDLQFADAVYTAE